MSDQHLPPPSKDDLDRYMRVLLDIKQRVQYSSDTLALLATCPPIEELLVLETSALQLRKALELLALSTLVTNKSAFERAGRPFKTGKASSAMYEVKKLNPRFWPQPAIGQRLHPDGHSEWLVPKSPLSEQDFDKAYELTSDIVHAKNPFKDRQRNADWIEMKGKELLKWMDAVRDLLQHHVVALLGGTSYITGRLEGGPDDPVVVGLAQPFPPEGSDWPELTVMPWSKDPDPSGPIVEEQLRVPKKDNSQSEQNISADQGETATPTNSPK